MKSIFIQAAAGFDCLAIRYGEKYIKIYIIKYTIAIITETKVLDTSMTFKTKVTIFRRA